MVMRILGLHIVSFITSLCMWGQDEFVSLEASPNPVEKGQQITITLKTNVEGKMDFTLPDEFEQSGPMQSGMSSTVNYSNGRGKVVRFSYQKLAGHFDDEGTFSVGPAKIHGKNGVVTSNVLTIKVRKRQNMISENPAENMDQAIFGIIEQSNKVIYEGQPLILEGKIYAQVDILQVERYVPFELDGPAETHDLQQSNQVMRNYEQVAGRNVMTFRIGKRLLFPEKTGTFEIDPFETVLYYDDQRSLFPERVKVRSNESTITVKPLPDGVPASFIEGVGSYSLSASIDSNTIEQGSVITVKVRILGHGNLHNIEAPKLQLPKGMILYGDPEVDDSVTYSTRGAEGMKTFTYYVQANTSGKITIPTIEAAYFDVVSEEYKVLKAQLPEINVKPSDNAVAAMSTKNEDKKETIEMMPPVAENDLAEPSASVFSGWKGGLWSCSPLALAFLLGGIVRIRKTTEKQRQQKQEASAIKSEVLAELQVLRSADNNLDGLQSVKKLLQRYLAIHLNKETVAINLQTIKSADPQVLNESLKKDITEVFQQVDELRYSGGAIQADVEAIIDKAQSIVQNV